MWLLLIVLEGNKSYKHLFQHIQHIGGPASSLSHQALKSDTEKQYGYTMNRLSFKSHLFVSSPGFCLALILLGDGAARVVVIHLSADGSTAWGFGGVGICKGICGACEEAGGEGGGLAGAGGLGGAGAGAGGLGGAGAPHCTALYKLSYSTVQYSTVQ